MRTFVLALAVTITSTSALPSTGTPLIGGEATGASQYSNVGAFGVIVDGTFFEICTGTIVAASVVLTAGHCTVFFDDVETRPQPFDIIFTLDPQPTAASTTYDAVAFYTHPDYVDELRGNSKCGLLGQCTTDVGLVALETSPGATAASLALPSYVDTLDLRSQVFTIVGYGLEGFINANTPIGAPGGTRKVGIFRAIGQDVTSDRFLKLSGRHSGAETCFGDSGGPVFADDVLVAVVSFGQSWVCASPGYYTRVDTASVSAWIQSVLTTIAE